MIMYFKSIHDFESYFYPALINSCIFKVREMQNLSMVFKSNFNYNHRVVLSNGTHINIIWVKKFLTIILGKGPPCGKISPKILQNIPIWVPFENLIKLSWNMCFFKLFLPNFYQYRPKTCVFWHKITVLPKIPTESVKIIPKTKLFSPIYTLLKWAIYVSF